MATAVLESCLIMINQSVEDMVPKAVFETDGALILDEDLIGNLYTAAMKAQLPTKKFRIGDNDANIEFFETTKKVDADAFLKQCEGLIYRKLQEAALSLKVFHGTNGVLSAEADIVAGRMQKLLDLRRILRNFAVLSESGGKKIPRLILHHAEINRVGD